MHASREIAARNTFEDISVGIVVLDPEISEYEDLIFRCEVFMHDVDSRDTEIGSIKILADSFHHIFIAGCLDRIVAAITVSSAITECESAFSFAALAFCCSYKAHFSAQDLCHDGIAIFLEFQFDISCGLESVTCQ